jgi:hypothetical protein
VLVLVPGWLVLVLVPGWLVLVLVPGWLVLVLVPGWLVLVLVPGWLVLVLVPGWLVLVPGWLVLVLVPGWLVLVLVLVPMPDVPGSVTANEWGRGRAATTRNVLVFRGTVMVVPRAACTRAAACCGPLFVARAAFLLALGFRLGGAIEPSFLGKKRLEVSHCTLVATMAARAVVAVAEVVDTSDTSPTTTVQQHPACTGPSWVWEGETVTIPCSGAPVESTQGATGNPEEGTVGPIPLGETPPCGENDPPIGVA